MRQKPANGLDLSLAGLAAPGYVCARERGADAPLERHCEGRSGGEGEGREAAFFLVFALPPSGLGPPALNLEGQLAQRRDAVHEDAEVSRLAVGSSEADAREDLFDGSNDVLGELRRCIGPAYVDVEEIGNVNADGADGEVAWDGFDQPFGFEECVETADAHGFLGG